MILRPLFVVVLAMTAGVGPKSKAEDAVVGVTVPTGPAEARSRALLLHELAHGALQVMHRDFFDDESPRAIPSASLQDVFKEMNKQFDVTMRWMTVDTDLVNVDHRPTTEFEQRAAAKLKTSNRFVEEISSDQYQFAGAIRLGSQCLKCHVKLRNSNEDRTAALLISMPMSNPDSR